MKSFLFSLVAVAALSLGGVFTSTASAHHGHGGYGGCYAPPCYTPPCYTPPCYTPPCYRPYYPAPCYPPPCHNHW